MATNHYNEALDPRKGRCAIATRALRAGTCVLKTHAVAAVSTICCGWCMRGGSSRGWDKAALSWCTGCRQVRYCSRACQRQDWVLHRRECTAWRQLPRSAGSAHTVLLVARLAAKLFFPDTRSAETEQEKQSVLALRHHIDDHTESKLAQYHEMTQLVLLLLSRYKLSSGGGQTLEELQQTLGDEVLQLFGRVNCNAFSLSDDLTNAPVGLGLFPQGALFNHTCAPNCVVSFQGQQMRVHTVRDVASGDELTVSYIELLHPSYVRRRELQSSYFFSCWCSRCKLVLEEEMGMEDWYLDGLACRSSECGEHGVINRTVPTLAGDQVAACEVCGRTPAAVPIDALEEEWKTLNVLQATAVSEQDKWMNYQQQWEVVSKKLKLHPRNANLAALAREIGNFLVESTDPKLRRQALPFFRAELHAVEWLLPDTRLPSRGLLHFQIGKLIFEADKTSSQAQEEATRHLQEALATLSCAYGSDSVAVQAAQACFDEIQRSIHENV